MPLKGRWGSGFEVPYEVVDNFSLRDWLAFYPQTVLCLWPVYAELLLGFAVFLTSFRLFRCIETLCTALERCCGGKTHCAAVVEWAPLSWP